MTTLAEYRSLFDLTGQRAAVIGAGSGLGEASALALAAHGATVTCADLDAGAAEATADAIVAENGAASSTGVDITDAESVDALFASAHFDTAVITPSINVRKQLLDMSEDEFARVVMPTVSMGADAREGILDLHTALDGRAELTLTASTAVS